MRSEPRDQITALIGAFPYPILSCVLPIEILEVEIKSQFYPFDDFELRDARQAANKVLAVDKTISVEMTTFDGLTVKLAFVVEGDKAWATIAASGEKKEGAKDHDAVKEAAEINARGQGWVFEIPDWKVTTLKQRLADVIKKKDDKK